MEQEIDGRREITSRNTKWANRIARKLTSYNLTPNQISMASILFAIIGGGMLFYSTFNNSLSLYIVFAVYILCIQLRLLCNLFDGMVAIEGGKKTPNGDLYNDIPDRLSDAFLIVPVGYVAGGIGIELAWLAALLAITTAYLRWIGAYKTRMHYFNGPMAKPHRMALLTCTTLVGIGTIHIEYYPQFFLIGLILMDIGLIVTLGRRLYFISHPKSEENKQ